MILILIASAFAAGCEDIQDKDECFAEPDCQFDTHYGCHSSHCPYMPRLLCVPDYQCKWASNKCQTLDCPRYDYEDCDATKCTKASWNVNAKRCLPKGSDYDEKDICKSLKSEDDCFRYGHVCLWDSGKCKANECYPKAEADCKDKCMFDGYCQLKDPLRGECSDYSKSGCLWTIECYLDDTNKCVDDPCYDLDETPCKANDKCKWGIVEALKEFPEYSEAMCYNAKRSYSAAFTAIPGLLRNPLVPILSALALFLLF